ncbi:hypothetical protein NX794_13610 [Streptomyces sp. LP11]|uniref:Uncharacterized protein n=1 Tax=Streptomyces pyxinicus TaxID=2970331 RepID=A0ABT2B291_9ACTN|nr:hypothetical protein [Streptomyces sp. LP11]MCS0602235.1 hypothetical protein [Streptomyces sp. LP11]
MGLVVREPLTPVPRCPEPATKGETCTADAHGETVTIHDVGGGLREVTITRRHGKVEAEASSQTLGEPGLRRLLDTLHPVSDRELEGLMREKTIEHTP